MEGVSHSTKRCPLVYGPPYRHLLRSCCFKRLTTTAVFPPRSKQTVSPTYSVHLILTLDAIVSLTDPLRITAIRPTGQSRANFMLHLSVLQTFVSNAMLTHFSKSSARHSRASTRQATILKNIVNAGCDLYD